jgi:hypothetical protein
VDSDTPYLLPDTPIWDQALPVIFQRIGPQFQPWLWPRVIIDDLDDIDDERIALALQAKKIMQHDVIPFPHNPCLVLSSIPGFGRIAIPHDQPSDLTGTIVPWEELCGPGGGNYSIGYIPVSEKGAVGQVRELMLLRVNKGLMANGDDPHDRTTIDAAIRAAFYRYPPWARLAYPDGQWAWTAADPKDVAKGNRKFTYDRAVQFFVAFAAIGMPCRHKLVITNRRGFGSSGMRKKTRGTKAYLWIRADRVYRHVRAINGNGSPRQPHERRCYYRHEWLKAGIDRFKLPKDPVERAIFAEVSKVETTFVRACWVGPRRFPGGPNEDVEVN